MKLENTQVFNFEGSLRGMRNPLESWNKSDSTYRYGCEIVCDYMCENYVKTGGCCFALGQNDLGLCRRLIKAGGEHRKFLRQIMVSVDITAPLYWWKEADTYKVGTVANSTSTMHKLAATPITMDCFEMDDFDYSIRIDDCNQDEFDEVEGGMRVFRWAEDLVMDLEWLRQRYIASGDKQYWKELIRWLPESWLQTRTTTMSYENIWNMYQQRCLHPHKLAEWSVSFKKWCESLPYFKELFLGSE